MPNGYRSLRSGSGNVEVTSKLKRRNAVASLFNTGYRWDPGAPLHRLLLKEMSDGTTPATAEEVQDAIIAAVLKDLDQPEPIRVGDWVQFQAKSGAGVGVAVEVDFGGLTGIPGFTAALSGGIKYRSSNAMMILIGRFQSRYGFRQYTIELDGKTWSLVGMIGATSSFSAELSAEAGFKLQAPGIESEKESGTFTPDNSNSGGTLAAESLAVKAELKAVARLSIQGTWTSWFSYAPATISHPDFGDTMKRQLLDLLGPGDKGMIKVSIDACLDRHIQNDGPLKPWESERPQATKGFFKKVKNVFGKSGNVRLGRYYDYLLLCYDKVSEIIERIDSDSSYNPTHTKAEFQAVQRDLVYHLTRINKFVNNNLVEKNATKSGDASEIFRSNNLSSGQANLRRSYTEAMAIINQTPSHVAVAVTETQSAIGINGVATAAALGQSANASAFLGLKAWSRDSASTFQIAKIAEFESGNHGRLSIPVIMTQITTYSYRSLFIGSELRADVSIPNIDAEAGVGAGVRSNSLYYSGDILYWLPPFNREIERARQRKKRAIRVRYVLPNSTRNHGRSFSSRALRKAADGDMSTLDDWFGFTPRESLTVKEFLDANRASIGDTKRHKVARADASYSVGPSSDDAETETDESRAEFYLLEVAFELSDDVHLTCKDVGRTRGSGGKLYNSAAKLFAGESSDRMLELSRTKARYRGNLVGVWLRKRLYDELDDSKTKFKIGFKIAYVAELNIELESVEEAGRHAVVTIAEQFFEPSSQESDRPLAPATPDKRYSPLVLFHV